MFQQRAKGQTQAERAHERDKRRYQDRQAQEVTEHALPHLRIAGHEVSGVGKMVEAVGTGDLLDVGLGMGMKRSKEPCWQKDCQQKERIPLAPSRFHAAKLYNFFISSQR